MKQLVSYNSITDFPKKGNSNVIYRDNTSMRMYRWDGEYIDLSDNYICSFIEGVLWEDENKNGLRESGESLLSGITVELWNEAYDTILYTTVSDSNGQYRFKLPEGNYYILPQLPDSYSFTLENVGTNDNIDSDFDLNNTYGYITILYGETIKYDVGFVKTPDYSITSTSPETPLETHGVTAIDIVLDVKELSNVIGNNPGDVVITLFKSSRVSVSYNPLLTSMNSIPIDNSLFSYNNTYPAVHVFLFDGVFPANGDYKIGITVTYDPQGSSGFTSLGFTISSLSVNDTVTANNTYVLVLNYFGS